MIGELIWHCQKENTTQCIHTCIWMKPPSQKSFVNLSLWRKHRLQAARGGGERHNRQNSDVQSVRREAESWREICLSNPASERTCQCHPSWLLGFHIWIEWSAMKTERAWRRWCSEAERWDENRHKKNAFTKHLRNDKRCVYRRALVADAERYPGKQINLLQMFVNEPIIMQQSILNLSVLPCIEWRPANANLESPLTKKKKEKLGICIKAKRHKRQSE